MGINVWGYSPTMFFGYPPLAYNPTAVAAQSDGKIIVAGGLASVLSTDRSGTLVRLNTDGTLDSTFNLNVGTAAGSSGSIWCIGVLSNGKIVVAGGFTTWNGAAAKKIVRLNPDGTLDTAFTAAGGTGLGADNVLGLSVHPDNSIVLTGAIYSFNGSNIGGVCRLDSSGALDTSFLANTGSGGNTHNTGTPLWTNYVQSDGKILICFTYDPIWNGSAYSKKIIRLNSNGTADTTFNNNLGTGASDNINGITQQSDGKLVLVGSFTTWNGTTVNRIVRLNSDGTRDTAFTTNSGTALDNSATEVKQISDGTLIIGGSFTTWNGTTVNRIVRLNSDGTRDTAFTTNSGTALDNSIYGQGNYGIALVNISSVTSIIAIGQFTSYNNTQSRGFIKLSTSGVKDSNYPRDWRLVSTPYAKVAGTWKPAKSTSVKVGGEWYPTFLQSGVNDYSFMRYAASNKAGGQIYSIKIQPDDKILMGGLFTTWDGTTVNRFIRLNPDKSIDLPYFTNIGTGPNSTVYRLALQSDGKVIIVGAFSTWNGTTAGRIVRLNADGTRDTTFSTNTGTAANTAIYDVAIQSDGKILVGGQFSTWNGVSAAGLVLLNSDGTLDSSFASNVGTGPGALAIRGITVQSSGKIIVVGNFTAWNGTTVGGVVRLNSDGTLDTAFTTNNGAGAVGTVHGSIDIGDGRILIYGTFTTWGGTTPSGVIMLQSSGAEDVTFNTTLGLGTDGYGGVLTARAMTDGSIIFAGTTSKWNGATIGSIFKLNADGTLNSAFTAAVGGAGGNTDNSTIAQTSDGKLLVGGSFTTWNGVSMLRFIQLQASGAPDTSSQYGQYSIGLNAGVTALDKDSSGNLFVAGAFTLLGTTTVNRLIKLNKYGALDTSFATNVGTGPGATTINALKVQPDGKIVIGGAFTSWNGTTVGRVVRLNADGTIDSAFVTNTGSGAGFAVSSVIVRPNGKIVLTGGFSTWNGGNRNGVVSLNPDGTPDTTFNTSLGVAHPQVQKGALQPDGKIVICGTSAMTWNGTATRSLWRINADGTLDTAFVTNIGTGWATNPTTGALFIQADGKIVQTSASTSAYNWKTFGQRRVIRVNADGTDDTTFLTNTGTQTGTTIGTGYILGGIELSNGKILLGGSFLIWNGNATIGKIVALNSDGTLSPTFTSNFNPYSTSGTPAVSVFLEQSDKKVVIGGTFSSLSNAYRSNLARVGNDGIA